jgi:hypothetical protein
MAYVDFDYYEDEYFGTAIAEADFPRLALLASADIDSMTFDRAAPVVTAAEDTATIALIKNATCAVAEEIQRIEKAGYLDGVTSESQGRYSVTFGANSNRSRSNQEKLETAAARFLSNTGLMFKGFYSGEYA